MKTRTDKLIITLLILLLLIGAGVRIYGAWCYRYNFDPDGGIVALMAKHIAEGRAFPIFFYGQGYMGSLEPATSALFCLVMGSSNGLAVNLGTALWGFLMLPILYLWGRDAGGRGVGLAAVALCLLGPLEFFIFQVAPRGGYPLTLFLGSVVVWLGARICTKELKKENVSRWSYFLLGLAAGLGWWNNQLISAALATAGILFLFALQFRIFSWRMLHGACGFILGSFPFWYWNAQNNWQTFQLFKSVGGNTFKDGLVIFGERFVRLMGISEAHQNWQIGVAAISLVLFLFGMVALIDSCRRKDDRRLYIIGALLFICISIAVFARSSFASFNTVRYLIPILPALAIIMAAGTVPIARILQPFGASLPVLALVAGSFYVLPQITAKEEQNAKKMQRGENLRTFLEAQNIDSLYSAFQFHSLNFLLDEEIKITDLKMERFLPIAQHVELHDRVGVLQNYGYIRDFIQGAGGSWSKHTKGMTVYHDFVPPEEGLREIAPDLIERIEDSQGRDLTDLIADRNADTHWQSRLDLDDPEWIDIYFKEPVEVGAVRLFSKKPGAHARLWRIRGKDDTEADWTKVDSKKLQTHYFWSGPRPYWLGQYFRVERRFEDTTVSALRLHRQSEEERLPWHLSELQVFARTDALPPEKDAFAELRDIVGARKIRRLYCDRWVANRMYSASEGHVLTPLDPVIFPTTRRLDDEVRLSVDTALLVRQENTDVVRSCVAARGIEMTETVVGPWVLFDFSNDAWNVRYPSRPGLYWAGFTCFLGHEKIWAASLAQQAKEAQAEGNTDAAIDLYREAIKSYPNHQEAMASLASLLREKGEMYEARQLENRYIADTTPAFDGYCKFYNDAELLGVTLSLKRAVAGIPMTVRYYWRCPPGVDRTQYAVFAHFKGPNNTRFQDDHVLLEDVDPRNIAFQSFDEVFVENRVVRIPKDAPEGDYRLYMGLYDRHTGRRIHGETSRPFQGRAIALPATLRLVSRREVMGERSHVTDEEAP